MGRHVVAGLTDRSAPVRAVVRDPGAAAVLSPGLVQLVNLSVGQCAVVDMHLIDRATPEVHLVAAELGSADHGVARGLLRAALCLAAGELTIDVELELAARGVADADEVVPAAG